MMNLFDKKFVYFEWDNTFKGKKVLVGDSLQLMRKEINDGVGMLRCVKDNGSDLYPFKDNCGTTWALIYYDPNYSCKLAYAQGKVIQCKHTEGSTWSDCTVPPSWYDDYEYRVKPEPELRVYKCSDDTLHISNSCIIDFLFEGTEDECKQYIKEHFCGRCAHQSCDMVVGSQFCKGFKKIVKSCGVCKYNSMSSHDEPCVSCTSRIYLEYKEVKKRRMTNRELSKWLAQGNGEWTDKSKDPFQIHCFVYQSSYSYEHDMDDEPVKEGYVIRGWDETEWHEPEVEV